MIRVGAKQGDPAQKLYETAGFQPAGTGGDYLYSTMSGPSQHIGDDLELDLHQLPAVITAYLARTRGAEPMTAAGLFDEDATITDNGSTYSGPTQRLAFLEFTSTEYTYTSKTVGAKKRGR
jgi:hypothetical protein